MPRTAQRSCGWWTNHKLQILEDYLQAFVTTTKNQSTERIYLDLFAGRPKNTERFTNNEILGSVHRALSVDPPFTRIALFELDGVAQHLDAAIRDRYGRCSQVRVYPGDCNATLPRALGDIASIRWAPTFAFVDQQATEVHWTTLERIARFRQARWKAEIWLLFGTSFLPRGLQWRQELMDAKFGEQISAMYGTDQWQEIARAVRAGRLDASQGRYELLNLMRWRLETILGYKATHIFTVKNTTGHDLFDMIFATDHAAGERIMAHLYGQAMKRHPEMQRQALARRAQVRRDKKAADAGLDALIPVQDAWIRPPETAVDQDRVYRQSTTSSGGTSVHGSASSAAADTTRL